MHQLKNNYFEPFSITHIKPDGWLKRQLKIQADGLCGHLDEFWPDIKNSSWFGGHAEGWERAPYWLDGLIPLAVQLQDSILLKKVHRYLNYILEHQHADGWLGPKDSNVENLEKKENYDIWGQFLILKVLLQYYDLTKEERITNVIEKCLRRINTHINFNPLFDWGQSRWFEVLIPIYWLYEKKPENWLFDLAIKLEAQGFNWKGFFKRWPMKQPTKKGEWNFMSHVVNNTMAIKAYALWWKLTGKEEDRDTVNNIIKQLEMFHGTAVGTVTGDECLAGKSPIRGTELCSVVEQMYSLENLISIFGNSNHADILEKITYNALPAAFTSDMWGHQYDQQINQIECSKKENRPWNTNGSEANIFGLEPHFGCCTVNFAQGWPKFTSNLWMKTQDNGIAVIAYAPSTLTTKIDKSDIIIKQETDYPFKDNVTITVSSNTNSKFPLWIRIPNWCKETTIVIDEKKDIIIDNSGFIKLERAWEKNTVIYINFKMEAVLSKRNNNSFVIQRGPLIYSLPIDEKRQRINISDPLKKLPHGDWEIYPKGKWNYALNISERQIENTITTNEKNVGAFPFSRETPPITIRLNGCEVPEWQNKNGSATDISRQNISYSDISTELTLIPYGCTNLRITEFPVNPNSPKNKYKQGDK